MSGNYALHNKTAIELYDAVKDLPIIDYHCHLSVKEIYENKVYNNITEMWLYGDHYKWRQMRTFGIDERYITGDASDYEKFEKYIEMLSYAIGSPLYVWSKFELEKYFGVTAEILPENAKAIYDAANKAIKDKGLCASKIMEISNVETVCTIEEVFCDLKYHKELKGKRKANVLPAIRVDKALAISDPNFGSYIDKLAKASGIKIIDLDSMLKAIDVQFENFNNAGCVSMDMAVEGLNYVPCDYNEAGEIFKNALSGEVGDADKYISFMSTYCLNKGYKYNFGVQLHYGAMRNLNDKMFEKLGVDTGFDSISTKPYLDGLVKLLNSTDEIGKTIIFNLNPSDNQFIGTLVGCFVGGDVKGRMQIGAAWWFNDNYKGITDMFEVICSTSLLATNVGMLTDSRSIISYPRHDYFRRLLCNFVGDKVEKGEFTENRVILEKIVKDVSYFNAKEYFGI